MYTIIIPRITLTWYLRVPIPDDRGSSTPKPHPGTNKLDAQWKRNGRPKGAICGLVRPWPWELMYLQYVLYVLHYPSGLPQ